MYASHLRLRRFGFAALLLLLLLCGPVAAAPAPPTSFDAQRAKLLGFILSQHLVRHHYSHKSIDDTLSRAAFDLYIKQLDAQKRFLLRTDLQQLKAYEAYIDNEIRRGTIHLPLHAAELLQQRLTELARLVDELLQQPLDFEQTRQIETDPKKLDFCATPADLRARWHDILTYQVANSFLDLQEEAQKAAERPENPEPLPDDATLERQAREKVAKRYRHLFARMAKEQLQDYFDRYLDAIARAYDPHSLYLPPEQKEDFDIHMRGSLEGIGALLREDEGYIKVVSLIPGGAAQRQGQLESEDIILKVAEGNREPVDISDTRIRDAVSLIRGPKGSTVRLHIRKPDGSRRTIAIVRDTVQIKETFARAALLEMPDGSRYGYLKIPSFYRDFTNGKKTARNVTDDVRRELAKLLTKGIGGLVLDLRNNGGGSLTDAVDTTGLFIDQGPVVQIRDSEQKVEVLADEEPGSIYDGPLIVLVNKFSASASEILAGALQDYGRAIVLGSRHTHGKGTVQAVIDLDSNLPLRNMEKYKPLGALKITVQKFYRVSGASTQYRGIEADIVLPDRFEAIKSGERHMDYSLPWDTIAATDYQPLTASFNLEQLQAASARRIATNPEFIRIAEQAERARRRLDDSRRSLQLADIRAERLELKDAVDEMDQDQEKEDSPQDDAALQEALAKDAYVQESLHLLQDMAGQPLSAPLRAALL
jgi:carboxyl-terminal processing protease